MNDFMDLLLRSDASAIVTPQTIGLMIVLSFAVGLMIGFVYMWTHEALSYSRTFVGALAMVPMIVSMMMLAMAGSLVVAFGLLGVFGVVRFRNVLKDTRDTSFILWGIVEGVAIGTMRYSTALLATLGIGTAFLLLRLMTFGVRHRYDAVLTLRVTGDFRPRLAALQEVLRRHATRFDTASEQRSTKEGTDVSYRLLLRDPSRSGELESELSGREGFDSVSVYMHEDEAEI